MKMIKKIGRAILSFAVWVLVVLLWLPLILVSWIINKMTPAWKKHKFVCVVGKTGAGKSLFKTYIETQHKKMGNKIWSNANQACLENVKDTPFECLFANGSPLVDLSGLDIQMMSFDEIQNQFNNRDFADKSYKSIFDPFVKALSIHRHIKVPYVYFYTQSWDNVDIKIRRLVHKIFEIENSKGIDFVEVYEAVRNGRKINIDKLWRVKRLKYIVWEPQDYENPQHKQYIEAVKKGFFKTELEIQDLERETITISRKLLATHNTYQFENTYQHLKTMGLENFPDQKEWDSYTAEQKEKFIKSLGV